MSTEVKVPTLGESVTEATIGEWLKKPGEAVALDEPIASLETDKVAVEVPSPVAGVMGQQLWQPSGPDGYPDTNAAWATPEGIKTRIDVAAQLGRQAAGSVADPRALVEQVLGPLASPQTRQAVARAESKPQALALLLMSPEFQRR